MSNSLRSNAERLLGDVQRVHSRLVAQIERVERAAGGPGGGTPRVGGRRHAREEPPDSLPTPIGDEELEVPEFIPPS